MAGNARAEDDGDLGDVFDRSPSDVEVKEETIRFMRKLQKQRLERQQGEELVRFYDTDDPQWIYQEPARRPCCLPMSYFRDDNANAEQIWFDELIMAAEQHLNKLRTAAFELRDKREAEEQRQLEQCYADYYQQQGMPFDQTKLGVAALLHRERHKNKRASAETRHHQRQHHHLRPAGNPNWFAVSRHFLRTT